MRRFTLTLALSLGLVSTAAGAAQPAPRSSLGVVTNVTIPSSVWNMQFTDSHGRPHTLASLTGTTLIVPFLTLCPDVCPFTTGNAIQTARILQSHHSANVRVIEITVDPQRDTIKRLAKYRKLVGLNSGDVAISLWRASNRDTAKMMKFFGMTTEKMSVDDVHRDWMTGKPIGYELDHSDGFYVITSQGKLRYVSGLSAKFIGQLTTAMKRYLNSAGLATLAKPSPGWTPSDAVTALSYIAQTKF